MADIKTEKQLVAVLNDPVPSNINLLCGPGVVGLVVKNEGVIHHCMLTPDEAVKMGVALIQLSGNAHGMQKNNNNNGIPGLVGMNGDRIPPGIIPQ